MLGFIGTGTIGAPMAMRLLASNRSLMVFDTDARALEPFAEAGAAVAENVAEIARKCETVFLSLPGPAQIKHVVSGADGLLHHAGELRIIVDLSTNALGLNRQISAEARARNIDYLDAPVSGGKVAAADGTLAVMVGGDEDAFNTTHKLIECFAENIFFLGGSGSGTLAKLVNNQIFLCGSVLVQEGFVLGAKAGMDANTLMKVVKASSAGSMMARAPLFLSKKFDLDIFALAIAAKDVGVALESADAVGASMPMTAAASEVYQKALDKGLGEEDFFATIKVLEELAGTEVAKLQREKR